MEHLHTHPSDLLDRLKDKWVVFDASAINILVEQNANGFWAEVEKIGITPCFIDPVALELTAYRDATARTLRLSVIDKLQFLPLLAADFVFARRLQNELHKITSKECNPSPTDLYLGAIASRFKGKLTIATSDMNDFPTPYYTRQGYLIIETPVRVRFISFVVPSDDTMKL